MRNLKVYFSSLLLAVGVFPLTGIIYKQWFWVESGTGGVSNLIRAGFLSFIAMTILSFIVGKIRQILITYIFLFLLIPIVIILTFMGWIDLGLILFLSFW